MTATGVAADNSPIPMDGIPNLSYDSSSNRITTAGFEYDVAGNQTRAVAEDGVTWVRYEYDAANRLSVVKRDDANQTLLQAFQYGSTNARLIDYDPAAGVNKFYASVGGTVMAEYTEYAQYVFTWIKSYTYLGERLLSTATRNGTGGEYTEYNHPDKLSTRLITNGINSYEQAHLPFGTALNAETTGSINRRFTSYDRSNSTGLDYAINRTYDSKLGRFTQVDPIGMSSVSLSLPQTLNLYAYCSNDPVNYTDPSGLFFGKLFKWIGKIFRAVNKVLKWVAIVIAVVLVAAFLILTFTPVSLPAFLGDGLGWLLGVMGKIGASSFGAGLAGAIGVEVGATAGSIISAGLVGVGAIASNFAQTKNQPKRKKGNFPCAPGFSQIYAQFGRFLAELLNSQSGHLTNSPLENGGWIYQDRKGKLFFLRAEKYGGEWRRKAGSIDLRTNPPNIRGARIVARAHTHPYNPGTQAAIDAGKLYGGPSSRATNGVDADVELSAIDKMPSYVVHQTGISSSGVREITITLANGAITRVNNEKCGGAK